MSVHWRAWRRGKLDRVAVEAQIEDLIALLDHIDGDCDLEPDADLEPDSDGEEDNEDCCAAYDDRIWSMGHMESYGAGDPDDAEDSEGCPIWEPWQASMQ